MSTLPAPSPVTPADLARAAYWKLTIPAPAMVAEVAPTIEPVADDEGDWDDDARWELGPEPDFASDDEAACGPAEEWQSITPSVSVRADLTPIRTIAHRDRSWLGRPTWDYGYVPTREERAQAAALFAPPPRKARPTGIVNADVYRPGTAPEAPT